MNFRLLGLGLLCLGLAACGVQEQGQKIPVTSATDEARQLYLQGRDLSEKLRAADSRELFRNALAEEGDFALAHLALATTASTNKEFYAELKKAVALVDQVSEGERLMILGLDAGLRNEPEQQRDYYSRLVQVYPNDERAHNLLAGFHFGQQEYDQAIEHYLHATEIDPEFSAPYNSLGYAYRFQERYDEAEKAFSTYVELLPDEPNPYDSYAELMMKTGRFEESIENYRQALERKPDFVFSYVGIANNQMFLGQFDEARATLDEMLELARDDGQRRTALFWTAVSYVHQDRPAKAIKTVEKQRVIAEAGDDTVSAAGDLALIGSILLNSGDANGAMTKYEESLALMRQADAPDEVKEAASRNHLYNLARAALAAGDLERAKTASAEYRELAESMQIPFELWQSHELAGMIALDGDDFDTAIAEFEQANQRDPRVLYQLAVACHKSGDDERARGVAAKAAEFNELNLNFVYVKDVARRLVDELG